MELAGDIFKRNLELVKMNGVMQTTNPNLFPTIFIDNVTNDLYIFYSNIREVDQCYRLNLEGMTDLFPGCDIFFGTAEIMAVDALQHYSSTGYSSLFEINAAYEPLTEPYPVEITELAPFTNNTDCPPGVPISQRFTVPAISFGYIKIPLLLTCKLGEPELDENKQIAIYPNPASSIINFLLTDQSVLNTKSIYELKIYASDGRELFATIHQIDKPLDVSYLTAGTYFIKLKSADFSSTIPFTICK